MKTLTGISASDGVVIGKPYYIKKQSFLQNNKFTDATTEEKRFLDAKTKVEQFLDDIYIKAEKEVGTEKAQIFEVHKMMLLEEDFNQNIINKIKEGNCAEVAVINASKELSDMFLSMDNDYMKARAEDIRDIADNLISFLNNDSRNFKIDEPSIFVAKDLSPSDTMDIDKTKILALVMEEGSTLSHTAILARTLGIPAMVCVKGILDDSLEANEIAIDTQKQMVYIEPDENIKNEINKKIELENQRKQLLNYVIGKETITLSGKKVELCANIGSPDDIPLIIENDAEGVGLFRSEFLFINNDHLPSEEEQFQAYKSVVQALNGKRVIIRTLDIGADKQLPYITMPKEENPAMGVRGIRLCFSNEDLFKIQLKAIFRASAFGKVAIMFPMVASLWEVKKAKDIIEIVKKQLCDEKIDFDKNVEIGIMIETPAAALISDKLAQSESSNCHCDVSATDSAIIFWSSSERL